MEDFYGFRKDFPPRKMRPNPKKSRGLPDLYRIDGIVGRIDRIKLPIFSRTNGQYVTSDTTFFLCKFAS
jgi:hypothetical protein